MFNWISICGNFFLGIMFKKAFSEKDMNLLLQESRGTRSCLYYISVLFWFVCVCSREAVTTVLSIQAQICTSQELVVKNYQERFFFLFLLLPNSQNQDRYITTIFLCGMANYLFFPLLATKNVILRKFQLLRGGRRGASAVTFHRFCLELSFPFPDSGPQKSENKSRTSTTSNASLPLQT